MSSLAVTDAISKRRAVRAFTKQPVPRQVVAEILTLAANAPSNSNVQPWKVHAISGAVIANLTQAVFSSAKKHPAGEPADVKIYPDKMQQPWRKRRADCGERMYSALNIARDDLPGRYAQGAKNLTFFGAPVGLIITLDRSMTELQFVDVGIFVQSILLLAHERGLATCPQAAWSMWSDTVRSTLELPHDEMILLGIALGFADNSQIAANIHQPRLKLCEYATLQGFD